MSPLSGSSFAHILARQNFADDARNTLGSWDSCMSKAYCKWPVVAAIIIGSLIVLSLVLCIARFCCCGIECCFGCCACCNACCPSPRSRQRGKYEQAPQQLPPQAYGYTPQMNYGFAPPQFATFDNSKGPIKEDSLPVMPSWQTSQTKKVEDTSYHGAAVETASTSDISHNGQEGIPLGAVSPNGRKMRDDVPLREQLYEDPVEQGQPMLSQQSSRPQQPQNWQQQPQYRATSPYQQDPHAYVSSTPPPQQQQQQRQQQQYQQSQPPQEYEYAQSEYSEGGNPYDTNSQAAYEYQQPQHSYSVHSQQTYTGYGNAEPRSPTSMYSNQYPPAYTSRAPSLMQRQQSHAQYQRSQQYAPQPSSQPQYRAFSPDLSTTYEPSSNTIPNVLSPGSAGHYQSEYHELGGGRELSRKPVS